MEKLRCEMGRQRSQLSGRWSAEWVQVELQPECAPRGVTGSGVRIRRVLAWSRAEASCIQATVFMKSKADLF